MNPNFNYHQPQRPHFLFFAKGPRIGRVGPGYPLCMSFSEKNITSTMDFLVNELGCKPAAVAQCHVLLTNSLEKRIKPRSLVARILNDKGLKNMTRIFSLLKMSEVKFLESYIFRYEKDIPELLDIYQGKLSPLEMGHFGRVVKSE